MRKSQEVHFKDCHFHDSVISDIDYINGELILYIPESFYECTYKNTKVKIEIDEDNLNFYFFKRFPRFKKVVWKGKYLHLSSLKNMFKKGIELEIEELLISPDSLMAVLECSVSTCLRRRGVEEKIRIEINDYRQIVLEDLN